MHAIVGTGVPDDSWSIAQIVAAELAEGAANGYTRTSIKPGSAVTPTFDSGADNRTEVAEQIFTATIPAGQTWTYRWTAGTRNGANWANRLITAVDATANTISFAANSGTFANGQRVIVTTEGGTLPGGVTALQIYTLQGVTGTTTITASLRAIGSGSNLDLTSTGSGTLRVRNVPELWFDVTVEDADQSASGTLSMPFTYFAKRAQAV